MDAVAFDPDADLGGGERLVVDPADLRAVERVGEVGAEVVDLEMVDTPANLLVDGEAHADRSVLDLSVGGEVRDRAHDLRDARLVVRAQKCRPVRGDDVVADTGGEDRILVDAQDLAGIARKHDVAPVPLAQDLRPHVGARLVLARVHVGDQAHGRPGGSGQRGKDVPVLCQLDLVEAELAELPLEELAEVALLCRARVRVGVAVGLRIDVDIAQEPLEHVARELLGERAREGRSRSQALPAE